MNVAESNIESVLQSANRRLSMLLGCDELPLSAGGTQTLRDELWVWGVLGGKDVGKSTLVNALAGDDVVLRGDDVGEGTTHPSAYLTACDRAALQLRFAGLDGVDISYRCNAPDRMAGLVLLDLPDFDSMFDDHVEQVRRMASLLDGVIWVTTPKKVGDFRAAQEIHRVLKDRTNFVYVVNKIDWLLAQSDGDACEELDRTTSALRASVASCDAAQRQDQTFAISAKYADAKSILDAIAQQRAAGEPGAVATSTRSLNEAAARLAEGFESLRRMLTSAPTREVIGGNKLANAAYQARTEARELLAHFQPRRVVHRLTESGSENAIAEIVERSLPVVFCERLMCSLNDEQRLFADFSTRLFKNRISHWPILGIIAWPLSLVGVVLGGIRRRVIGGLSGIPGLASDGGGLFQMDGLRLDERFEAIVAGVRSRLGRVGRQVGIDWPAPSDLASQFRVDVLTLTHEQQSAVIGRLLDRRPTLVGRGCRWLLAVGVLLWFPLVQPLLEITLSVADTWPPNMRVAASVFVAALSARHVLNGLFVSLLLMTMMVASVYSMAVRDSFGAIRRLERVAEESSSDLMLQTTVRTLARPIERVCTELSDTADTLERLVERPS